MPKKESEKDAEKDASKDGEKDAVYMGEVPKVLRVKDPPYLKVKPLHPHLPQPPALMLLCSPVKTGKSTLVSNLLLNSNFYGQEYFDQTYIISNTIHNDDTSRFLKEAYDCHDHYDDSIVMEIIHRQNQFEKKDMPEIALVLDDVLGSLKAGSYVNKLSTRFRHYNIRLLLFSTQVFRCVSNIVRQNVTNLVIGSPFANRSELTKIAEEYGEVFGGIDNFLKIYKLATPARYDFLYCDLQSNPPLAYHNFEYLVAEGMHIVVSDGGGNQNDELPEAESQTEAKPPKAQGDCSNRNM